MSSPQSVTRVIRILELLCASAKPLSLAHMSRELAAPKSSIASLLRGLADADFVMPADGGYRLGPAAFGLGSALQEARRGLQSFDLVRQGMHRLAQQSGETVLFAVRDSQGDSMTYVDVIESRNAVRFAAGVGDRRPLYCTAGGRVLLASLPDSELAEYFHRLKPESFTERTEIAKSRLMQAVQTVRETGVAQTVDQAEEGVTGTAAGIHDADGSLLGAVVAAAPSARIPDRGAVLAQWVLTEARNISRNLGYRAGQQSS